jgi:xylulose-5-phosphate/fructose-6-phosphate phosphoketolase
MTVTTSRSAAGSGRPDGADPLSQDELRLLDAYWRAANYLSVGQIYLLANPLLREPLGLEHVKPRLLGRWPRVGSPPSSSTRSPTARCCRSCI